MEIVGWKSKMVSFSIKDRISDMPENVIVDILDRMPIQDAVATSLLSRSWRFNWTLLTQLIFNEDLLLLLRRKRQNEFLLADYAKIIHKALFRHKGSILRFTVYIPDQKTYGKINNRDINRWFPFLSTNGIKEFTLAYMQSRPYKLPSQLFSCLALTDLKLCHCSLNPPPAFTGFPNLINLEFYEVTFKTNNSGNFISGCPLLERFTLTRFFQRGNLKSIPISKLQNLKGVVFSLLGLHDPIPYTDIIQVVGSLPKLEDLYLGFDSFEVLLAEAVVRKRVPAVFHCLKLLILHKIYFHRRMEVLCAVRLICGSPNLRTLVISVDSDPDSEQELSDWEEECTMGRLRRVTFKSIKGLKNEMRLIKFLLASSPLLENMTIGHGLAKEERIVIEEQLKKFHRASPKAEIDLM